MKQGKVTVRTATPADYPAIASLLNRTFGNIPLERRKKLWEWRYDSNPAKTSEMPRFLLAEQDGMIVGVHGLTPIRMKAGDRQFTAACSCDLAVEPSSRSAGLKIKLKALSKELSPFPISTSANEPANKITLALGGKEIIAGRRKFLKPLKTSGFLHRKIANKAGALGQMLAGVAGVVIGKPLDWILAISRSSKSFSKIDNAVIEDIYHFDQRFDQFWELASQDYPVMVVRDSAYLNWRYMNYPFEGAQSFGLFQEDRLLGFAVIHIATDEDNLRFAAILEILVPKGDKAAFEHLLGESIRRAARAGAHYIQAKTLVAEWEMLFMRYGFKALDSRFSPTTYKNNTGLPDELFANETNWYMSLGDGDICYFL